VDEVVNRLNSALEGRYSVKVEIAKAVAEVTYPLILVENWTGEIRERVRQGGG
jgi:hypothetical protein